MTCRSNGKPSTLECVLAADDESPVINPCFVIKNWGNMGVELTVDTQKLECGKQFRFGHRHSLEGSDLVIWIERECTKPLNITISPVRLISQ